MSKMTRDSLKSLVKECLFEILLEATGDSSEKLNEVRSKPRRRATSSPARKKTVRPALDNIQVGRPARKSVPAPQVDVSGLTSDPVMAAIFQDTAATTLVEQAAAERGKPQQHADVAAQAMSKSDPSDVFGEASKNWAALAFDD